MLIRTVWRKIKLIPVYKPILDLNDVECMRCGRSGCSFSVALDHIRSDAPVIYSFGVGEDNSFDLELLDRVGGRVYAFDPTPKSIRWVEKNVSDSRYIFYPYGISDQDEMQRFHQPKNENYVSGSVISRRDLKEDTIVVPMKRLSTIMKELGHEKIDVLKMDIEGSEFAVIPDILETGCRFDQLCIETHNRYYKDGNQKLKEMLQQLRDSGYQLVFRSENYEELTFIRNR